MSDAAGCVASGPAPAELRRQPSRSTAGVSWGAHRASTGRSVAPLHGLLRGVLVPAMWWRWTGANICSGVGKVGASLAWPASALFLAAASVPTIVPSGRSGRLRRRTDLRTRNTTVAPSTTSAASAISTRSHGAPSRCGTFAAIMPTPARRGRHVRRSRRSRRSAARTAPARVPSRLLRLSSPAPPAPVDPEPAPVVLHCVREPQPRVLSGPPNPLPTGMTPVLPLPP